MTPKEVNAAFRVPRYANEGGARRKLTPPSWALVALAVLVIVVAVSFSFYPPLSAQPLDLTEKFSVDSSGFHTPRPDVKSPVQIEQNNGIMASNEQTFIAIKPDGVQRGLIGPIISRFESRGYKLVAIKLVTPGLAHLEQHYADLKDKPFFPGLINYMNSGPICAMVWEGRDAVKTGRAILGATNPLASSPGTIRGDYALVTGRNVCHGSDSVENAQKEIALWFKEGEVLSWKSAMHSWIYED